MTTTFERVCGVIVDVMTVDPRRVTTDTDIEADLGPDSLEQVEIVMGLETEFEVDLGDDLTRFGMVGDVVDRIDAVLEGRE